MYFSFLLQVFFAASISASHYRGGSISWSIKNSTGSLRALSVGDLQVEQRHSFRNSYGPDTVCNQTTINRGGTIGHPNTDLICSSGNCNGIPHIDSKVPCTDYNFEYDYSSGMGTQVVPLPVDTRIEYTYSQCCWIPLLHVPNGQDADWSLTIAIDTNRRRDGRLNSSPKSSMIPIVRVEKGKLQLIRIPMADPDGDDLRCRWGKTTKECGGICSPKGVLRSNPCEFFYNASEKGYEGVAVVIEDFEKGTNRSLSSIPLQFLVHIVDPSPIQNETTTICQDPPEIVGDRPNGACIGIASNTTVTERIVVRVPCRNTTTNVTNILTISPQGMKQGPLVREDINLYTMNVSWTPRPDQYGVHPFCATPTGSEQQMGAQVCVTFQVDMKPPTFYLGTPSDAITSSSHNSWSIRTDQAIVRPRRSGVFIRFFKRLSVSGKDDVEVLSLDVSNPSLVIYNETQISFYTFGISWEQETDYYILFDSGIGTLNESCGVESDPVTDRYFWTFRLASPSTQSTTYSPTTNPATVEGNTKTCADWREFGSVSNETTNEQRPSLTFCFTVTTAFADVTIAANTWVPCSTWKKTGAADPFMELYVFSPESLLAVNDDGNSLAFRNCFASVISYRLAAGEYKVIVRHPKCAYGWFELRLAAETENSLSKK